ncbi:MAG: DUF58 domain-containing protein, partial [Actinomycetota bacterium]|nr:DUF58 domain-containing protein [Actinomycetota bacterium]
AWAWVRLAVGPAQLRRGAGRGKEEEGDDVEVDLLLQLHGRVPPPHVTIVERIAKVGERRSVLERRDGDLLGGYVLEALPRGRYVLEEATAVVQDPFGLERQQVPLRAAGTILVYPRLVELDRLFSEVGAHAQDGRRLLLRRPSGFDLHSVREYEEGESLRKVHWPTTARRGRLMVKELEDAPRDEIAVVLDGDASAVVGESFDVQVRAAGSLLRAHAQRGRRAVLIVNAAAAESHRVHSDAGEWQTALELLASVEPSARTPVTALLGREGNAAVRALELAVVTARLAPGLADRLIQRALNRRGVSLVYVDSSSFGPKGRGGPEPELLRIQAAGVAVAIVRRGDDLARALSGSAAQEALRA